MKLFRVYTIACEHCSIYIKHSWYHPFTQFKQSLINIWYLFSYSKQLLTTVQRCVLPPPLHQTSISVGVHLIYTKHDRLRYAVLRNYKNFVKWKKMIVGKVSFWYKAFNIKCAYKWIWFLHRTIFEINIL